MTTDIICGQLLEALTHDMRSTQMKQNLLSLFLMVTEAEGICYACVDSVFFKRINNLKKYSGNAEFQLTLYIYIYIYIYIYTHTHTPGVHLYNTSQSQRIYMCSALVTTAE